eukprot:Skav230240  [mRNA]  locus=scaffold1818:78429:87690:+ [translate_table: standard]
MTEFLFSSFLPVDSVESMAECAFGSLLDERRHERAGAFGYLTACVVKGDAATSVGYILQSLRGDCDRIRVACAEFGIPVQEGRRFLSVEDLKHCLRQKVLSLLPPVTFGALLEHAPAAAQAALAEYARVFVVAQDAERVGKVLKTLGPVPRDGRDTFRVVCADWNVARQHNRKERPLKEVQAELRGTLIRFLKESPASTAVARAALVAESCASAAVSRAERAADPQTFGDALATVQQRALAPRLRMSSKKQAVDVFPRELASALERHAKEALSRKEQTPWMLLAGCKQRRRYEGKEVHPSFDMATWETERALVEKVRIQLRLDPECRDKFTGKAFETPKSLEQFSATLQDPQIRLVTPFGKDFRYVHLPTNWDGQHVMRRLALLEEGITSAGARCSYPLLDGALIEAIRLHRCSVDPESKIASFPAVITALEQSRTSMPDQPAWFFTSWGIKDKTNLENVVNDMDQFFAKYDLRDLWTSVSQGTLMVWIAWFAILRNHGEKKVKAPEVVTESRTLLKSPVAKYVLSERVDGYPIPPHFKQDALCMRGVSSASYDPATTVRGDVLPVVSAPHVCELCGDGFVTWQDLGKHVEASHVNWAEYRKRVFWHAQFDTHFPCYGLPLSWRRKRRMIANATTRLVSSEAKPSKNLAEEAETTTGPMVPGRDAREMVGCAVCATKCWAERMRRCFMFRTLAPGQASAAQHESDGEENDPDSSPEDKPRKRGELLADKHGILYFGPSAEIDKFFNVKQYQERWPLIPAAELHASSAQHPDCPEYKWLLHTRRVPVLPTNGRAVAPAEATGEGLLAGNEDMLSSEESIFGMRKVETAVLRTLSRCCLREEEAPPDIVAAAVHMDEANLFRPNLTGPAGVRASHTAAESRDDEIVEIAAEDEEPEPWEVEGEKTAAGARGEPIEAEEAENLIGLDEAAENDPLQHYVVLQNQVRRLQEDQQRIERQEAKLRSAQGDQKLFAGTQAVAAREACHGHALELREVCRRLTTRHEKAVEAELQLLEGVRDETSQTLVVKSGELLSMFVPESWCLCFTEFFYGDCLPFDQSRPVRLAPHTLMACLLQREELEYHLEGDEEAYVSAVVSRWDNPEVVAMFADTLRRQKLLMATKMNFLNHDSFKLDLQAIAKAKPEDFLHLQKYNTLGQAYASTAEKEGTAMKALKHLLTSTAVVPLTEGNKMKLRHFGHAMDVTFGPLKLFMTCNFADTYMPLTLVVFDPENQERLVTTRCNLLEELPEMPTLQDMHRIVARSPATQAKLFLLMEEIILTELLGVQEAFIGNHRIDDPQLPERMRLQKEDHLASNGSMGLADFVEALLMPLEAQGRGFAHGHKKVISLPSYSAATLKKLFQQGSTELKQALETMRTQVLDAVSTVQYDTATLPAQQLGITVPLEPFTRQQQRQSRLDGGQEESGERRPLLGVTEQEPPGHIALEQEKAMHENRPPRQGYKEVSLTGCHQSVMPLYRLPGSFGGIVACDERGLFRAQPVGEIHSEDLPSKKTAAVARSEAAGAVEAVDGDVQNIDLSLHGADEAFEHDARAVAPGVVTGLRQPWILAQDRSVLGFRHASGRLATAENIEEDAQAWAVAFGRDVRGVFCQNHDHNCVATCSKYAKPITSEQQPATGSQIPRKKKLDPRDYCRFLFVRVVELKVLAKIKKVLRRGKELVTQAFVCRTNARNEYGRVQVVRKHPFRSSSSDVCQAVGRCNVDIQRNDRVVPEALDGAALTPVTFFYGHAQLSETARHLLASYAEGVRSSHICDFYMTKYLAKGQQVLASAVTPVLHGLKRLEEEVAAGTKVLGTTQDLARAKLRRILFSANRAHWFSACELAIFILTDGHSISTHIDRPMFLSKVFYLLEEGKRLRNGSVRGQFLHEAMQTVDTQPMTVDVVQMLPSEEHARAVKRQRLEATLDETMYIDEANEDDSHDPIPAEVVDSSSAVAPAEAVSAEPEDSSVQMFRATASTYDDWLHRGFFLQDMDFHCYVAYVEVVSRTQGRLGQCFAFDDHYIKSKTYWQRLAQRVSVPRVVGASCPRLDVGEGEDNARYKLALFGLMRCPGRGACADPVALSQACLATDKNDFARFRTGWQLRRARIEIEAQKADEKIAKMKKLPTPWDCTTFRYPEGNVYGFDWMILCQVVYNCLGKKQCFGEPHFYEVVTCIATCLTSTHLFAKEQLHLSEFVSHRSRDLILRLDLHTEARNTAVQLAKSYAEATVEDDVVSVASDKDKVLVEVENVGGEGPSDGEIAGDENEGADARATGVDLSTFVSLSPDSVRDSLLHTAVLTEARQRHARVPDAVKYMLEVENALGAKVAVCRENFPVRDQKNWLPQGSLEQALLQQDLRIQMLRREDMEMSEGAETAGARLDAEESAVGSRLEQQASVRLITLEERARGPAFVAKKLAEEASLNRDQLGFVAIVAVALQSAWVVLPAERDGTLPKDKALLRCLLVGGGGCGKTRIINQVLRPLFLAFFGDHAVQTQAPSNKAARQIHGKTLHSANKLTRDSSLRTVHLRLSTKVRKALELSTSPLGAVIIDEFSQCIGQMFHADALRKTYGRQSAYNLELHRYAEPLETWGRMPVVVVAGDELQLPPVPFEHSLLATTDGTSDEHKAGVHLFGNFAHVYRLSTAMRFKDDVLVAILTKMRTPGGTKLTEREWEALKATSVDGPGDQHKLEGTEHFFQSCYTWSVVSLAYAVRSFESAKAAGATLYATKAIDVVQNVPADKCAAVAEALLAYANMNETGRLPHFGLYHVGMEVRLTQTLAAPHVVVDCVGVIRGFQFAAEDLSRGDMHGSFVVLRKLPEAIFVELEDVPEDFLPAEPCSLHAPNVSFGCVDCQRLRGMFAVRPYTSGRAWTVKVKVSGVEGNAPDEPGAHKFLW